MAKAVLTDTEIHRLRGHRLERKAAGVQSALHEEAPSGDAAVLAVEYSQPQPATTHFSSVQRLDQDTGGYCYLVKKNFFLPSTINTFFKNHKSILHKVPKPVR